MKRLALLAAAALVSTLALASCSSDADPASGGASGAATAAAPAAFQDREADGEALANAWFELLSQTGSEAGTLGASEEQAQEGAALVRPYLDSAFILKRASGERHTADNYVPIDIDAYEISNVVVTSPREDIKVVRYAVSTPGAADLESGMLMSGELEPRLTVFRWDAELGHWVLVSHANYNHPVASICNQAPITVSGPLPDTSAEDVALGESLAEQWRQITLGESKEKVRHPEIQIQLADGQAWPTVDGSEITWTPATAYEFDNLAVTRNDDLMVLSYDAVTSDLEMEGSEYRDTASPRLLTYLQSDEGKWEMIALANFTVPTEVPATLDCVSSAS